MIVNACKCVEVCRLGMDGGGSERLPAAGGAQLHPRESNPGVVGCGGEDDRLLVFNFDSDADRRSGKAGTPGEAAAAATQHIASEWDVAAASGTETIQQQNKTTGKPGTDASEKK